MPRFQTYPVRIHKKHLAGINQIMNLRTILLVNVSMAHLSGVQVCTVMARNMMMISLAGVTENVAAQHQSYTIIKV